MRIITSYACTLDVESAEEAAWRFNLYRGVMDDWLHDQGISEPRADSPEDTFVQLKRRDVSHEGAEIDGFLLKQPILESSHLLHTRFDLAVSGHALALFLQFSVERLTNRVAPIEYQVSCPRALRTILDAGRWMSGQARVRPHCRRVYGLEAGKRLASDIKDPDRTLPIVLLANFANNAPRGDYQELIEPYDENEWEDFISRVEDELSGVALIVDLDSASDSALLPPPPRNPIGEEENELGGRFRALRPSPPPPNRRRGMYGAVVRIIWPLGTDDFDQFRHPAWAPYELFADPDSGVFYNDSGNSTDPPDWMATFGREQLMLLRRHIRDQIYEQAALQPMPVLIDDIRRTYTAAERERLTASGDFDALEELYLEEIAEKDEALGSLRGLLDSRDGEFRDLQDKLDQQQATINQLQFRLGQAKGGSDDGEQIENATLPSEPVTVAEAVEIARSQCTGLSFGPHATDKLDGLSSNAGPPRKILSDLKLLNQCSQLLQERGSLGQDVIAWLKDQNVNASKESSTRVNKHAAELKFPTVRDTYELMGDHIKYRAAGLHREARVHFKAHVPEDDGETATIDIGYVGPKIKPD